MAVSPGAAPGLSGQSAGMFLNSTVQGTPPNREFTAEAEKHCSKDSLLKDMAHGEGQLPLRDHHLIQVARLTAASLKAPAVQGWGGP